MTFLSRFGYTLSEAVSMWCSNLAFHFILFFGSCQATLKKWNKSGCAKESGCFLRERLRCNLVEIFTQVGSCKVMWPSTYIRILAASLGRTGLLNQIRSDHWVVALYNDCLISYNPFHILKGNPTILILKSTLFPWRQLDNEQSLQ